MTRFNLRVLASPVTSASYSKPRLELEPSQALQHPCCPVIGCAYYSLRCSHEIACERRPFCDDLPVSRFQQSSLPFTTFLGPVRRYCYKPITITEFFILPICNLFSVLQVPYSQRTILRANRHPLPIWKVYDAVDPVKVSFEFLAGPNRSCFVSKWLVKTRCEYHEICLFIGTMLETPLSIKGTAGSKSCIKYERYEMRVECTVNCLLGALCMVYPRVLKEQPATQAPILSSSSE